MAGRSVKRKKKSDLKPNPPMASDSSPLSHTKISIVIFLSVASIVIIFLSLPSNTLNKPRFSSDSTQIYSVEVVNEFHHDPYAFTQGLLYGGNETLFESTGLFQRSSVRKVALQTGKIEALQKMEDSYFGEGLTLLGERLFQVTWLKKTGFIYDRSDLSKCSLRHLLIICGMVGDWQLMEKFCLEVMELRRYIRLILNQWKGGSFGWTSQITCDACYHRHCTFATSVIGEHIVKYKGHEVHNLNELEFVDGEVWANVWQTDCIARISHEDGTVRGWILLNNLREGLLGAGKRDIDVLNGIAWDSEKNRIFVTGKLWPKLYEIKVHPMNRQFEAGVIEQLCLRMPFFT